MSRKRSRTRIRKKSRRWRQRRKKTKTNMIYSSIPRQRDRSAYRIVLRGKHRREASEESRRERKGKSCWFITN